MAAIYCYGCGKDITSQASNRYNMLSVPCFKALPIWKKMASERFKELNIEVDIRVDCGGGALKSRISIFNAGFNSIPYKEYLHKYTLYQNFIQFLSYLQKTFPMLQTLKCNKVMKNHCIDIEIQISSYGRNTI